MFAAPSDGKVQCWLAGGAASRPEDRSLWIKSATIEHKVQRIVSEPRPTAKQWMILRRLADGPLGQQELCRLTGRRPQAMAKSLSLLEEAGWAEPVDERRHAGPNAPARRWRLTAAGEAIEGTGPGRSESDQASRQALRPHQGFVSATVSSREIPRLMEVLAQGQIAAEAATVARLDGDSHAFLFLFEPELGAGPSEAVSAALEAMSVSFTVGTVSDVRTWEEFVSDARAARASRAPVSAEDPGQSSREN